jgi:hypothetical protein
MRRGLACEAWTLDQLKYRLTVLVMAFAFATQISLDPKPGRECGDQSR